MEIINRINKYLNEDVKLDKKLFNDMTSKFNNIIDRVSNQRQATDAVEEFLSDKGYSDKEIKVLMGLWWEGEVSESINEAWAEGDKVKYQGKVWEVYSIEDGMLILVTPDGKERVKVLKREVEKVNEGLNEGNWDDFKVGDRVKFVMANSYYGVKEGEQGTVSFVSFDTITVQLDGKSRRANIGNRKYIVKESEDQGQKQAAISLVKNKIREAFKDLGIENGKVNWNLSGQCFDVEVNVDTRKFDLLNKKLDKIEKEYGLKIEAVGGIIMTSKRR